jgi:ribonuclease VapC
MIVVDTSALMAVVLGDKAAKACSAALQKESHVLISAGTMVEALIVAGRRNVGEEVASLIDGLGFEVVAVTATSARLIAHAYERWAKGANSAGLNFGDCFAYAVAKEYACPLLYIGNDFAKTDIESVL